jgi:2,4-dienoyl-CoA reductase-like NADH-dependent reductase (Old Yellow Enzyme family)/thioredoxin reductase
MMPSPFTALQIGPVEVGNRLAMAPVKTAFGSPGGLACPEHVAYYRRRAQGGAGLIIVEPLFVDPRGREHPKQLGVHSDEVVSGLGGIVAAIHEHGALAFAHLNHAGRAANPKAIGGAPEAPSAVVCPATGAVPEPMTGERIVAVLESYGRAARRVREAGFDGVELQLGLGYLPAQFLSPRTNQRADDYGSAGESRWRFIQELVGVVATAAGPDLAVMARMSADEKVDGGLGLDDALELANRLEGWGVHALHVVTGSACDSPPWYYQHMALPPGVNEALAGRIRASVSVPVMVAGRLGDPDRIRDILDQGMADAIALGRPLVADPDLPRKMREGREDEIMSCGACLQGCLAKVKAGGPIGCIVNPELGHEADWPLPAAAVGERLVVVGGGPAGMAAALTAHRVGYRVTLVERRRSLGGQFTLAPLTTGKEAMDRPLRSLVTAVERSGVDVRIGVDATVETVVALEPDQVIVATGSRPVIPPVPGLDDPLSAEQVLTGDRAVGNRVLILGGGLVGIEMAEQLGQRGHEVVVVELLDVVARDMEAITRAMTLRRLEALPVEILTATRLVRMDGREAIVASADDGDERSLERFDSVLVSVGHRSFDPLSDGLGSAGVSVSVVGDASHPGQIFDATQAGRSVIEALFDRAGGDPEDDADAGPR